jgi:N-hydroxyarylamine O-acetyltransferase
MASRHPRWPVDYVVFNWYTSTHPRSAFTQRPVVQKVGDGLRRSLVGGELTLVRPGWIRETRPADLTDLPETLAADFGIELTPPDAAALLAGTGRPSASLGRCRGVVRYVVAALI